MCIVKTPKLTSAADAAPKEPIVIRNPHLDGVSPASRAARSGRSGLRIERGVAGRPIAAVPGAIQRVP